MKSTKSFDRIFHADDWGLSPSVNQAILNLARRNHIKSVALLANASHLESSLNDLLGLSYPPALLLHFNLTYGQPLTAQGQFLSHRHWIQRSLTGQVDINWIEQECGAQIQRLKDLRIPLSGLNGHHHIHLLPRISTAVFRAMSAFGLNAIYVLRDSDHWPSYLQTRLFELGQRAKYYKIQIRFLSYLRPKHLKSAASFFSKVARSSDRPLLIHPSIENDFDLLHINDDLRDQRVHEYNSIQTFLSSAP